MTKEDKELALFGENDFIQYCHDKGLYYIDVRDVLLYQLVDIDFIRSSKPLNYETDIAKCEHDLLYYGLQKEKIYKIEVKTDVPALTTRNFVYEVMSHDNAGGLGKSMADYIYYVIAKRVDGVLTKKEAWYINLRLWRRYIREHYFTSSIKDYEANTKYGIRKNNFVKLNDEGKEQDTAANYLTNIEILEADGIAKRVF